jgi:hypothetical protein
MIGTYASAALICAASMLVGRAILGLGGGGGSRCWLAPAVGFGAVLTVTGFLARAPGHATTATLGLVALVIAAAALLWWQPRREGEVSSLLREGLPLAVIVGLLLSIPFAVSGRWGVIGVGFNNDLGLHMAWAEWLRSGLGPAPEAGYPLGPHALADAIAAVPGIGLGQAFVGEIFAIGILTALTALVALDDLGRARRVLAAALVAIPYLGASYFAQGAFKETAEALFVLAFALLLHDLERRRRAGEDLGDAALLGAALAGLALVTGIFFSYSFAGLAWPLLIFVLWGIGVAPLRRALYPRHWLATLRRPAALLTVGVLVALAVLTVVGPYAFIHGFNRVAGTNTYGPVSPLETLGVWPTSNYRLSAAGGAQLSGLAAAIAAIAVLAGGVWWLRRRQYAVPLALVACAVLYLAALAGSGEYSQAKALMIGAPPAMLIAIRPLLSELGLRRVRISPSTGEPKTNSALRLAWAGLAVVFVAGAVYSSLLVLRDAPIGPPGHGSELRAFMPILDGEPVLYAGQDRYAAHELMGADTHVPLVEFPDADVSPNPEKPFDTGDAYSPIDFDSFSKGTLDRFPYVITGRAAWNSEAPPNFRRVAATPSYVLWKRTGATPEDRHVLLEGTEAGAKANCASPEIRILTANPGRAGLFPAATIGSKGSWSPDSTLQTGERASQALNLPRGRWRLSLQYFSPFGLTLSAAGFSQALPAALDGRRPSTISLASNGQFWPAGIVDSPGGKVRFTAGAAEASTLQSLSGYSGSAELGELVAVRAEPHRTVSLTAACGAWLDWYEADEVP